MTARNRRKNSTRLLFPAPFPPMMTSGKLEVFLRSNGLESPITCLESRYGRTFEIDIVQLPDIKIDRRESPIDDFRTAWRFKVHLQQQPKTKVVSILIVEDNRAACKLIGRMVALKFPDAVVYSADNGATGVELFVKHAPNVVLTDISMPEMNGFEMANEIQSLKPDTKIIVFTAHSEGDFLPQFKGIGVDTYLSKPLALGELMTAIEECTVSSSSSWNMQNREC